MNGASAATSSSSVAVRTLTLASRSASSSTQSADGADAGATTCTVAVGCVAVSLHRSVHGVSCATAADRTAVAAERRAATALKVTYRHLCLCPLAGLVVVAFILYLEGPTVPFVTSPPYMGLKLLTMCEQKSRETNPRQTNQAAKTSFPQNPNRPYINPNQEQER